MSHQLYNKRSSDGFEVGMPAYSLFVTSSLLFLEPYRLVTSSITSPSPTTLLSFLIRRFLDDDVHSIQSSSPSLCKRTPVSSVERSSGSSSDPPRRPPQPFAHAL